MDALNSSLSVYIPKKVCPGFILHNLIIMTNILITFCLILHWWCNILCC